MQFRNIFVWVELCMCDVHVQLDRVIKLKMQGQRRAQRYAEIRAARMSLARELFTRLPDRDTRRRRRTRRNEHGEGVARRPPIRLSRTREHASELIDARARGSLVISGEIVHRGAARLRQPVICSTMRYCRYVARHFERVNGNRVCSRTCSARARLESRCVRMRDTRVVCVERVCSPLSTLHLTRLPARTRNAMVRGSSKAHI